MLSYNDIIIQQHALTRIQFIVWLIQAREIPVAAATTAVLLELRH